MPTPISLTFIKDEITDDTILFPSVFEDQTDEITVTDPNIPVNRFRYRGIRESSKWNSFITAADTEINKCKTNTANLASQFVQKSIGCISNNITMCSIIKANIEAIAYCRRGIK